jgi:hypothetical protein
MLTCNHHFTSNSREKLLEMRIENLQERIRELEREPNDKNKVETNKSSCLVLPVMYTPIQEPSPKLEIVPCSSRDQSRISLLFVEQSKTHVYETVV